MELPEALLLFPAGRSSLEGQVQTASILKGDSFRGVPFIPREKGCSEKLSSCRQARSSESGGNPVGLGVDWNPGC